MNKYILVTIFCLLFLETIKCLVCYSFFPPSVYPCDSSPCKNGGTCGNDETEFTCECTEQFEGPTCETEGIYTAF